MREVAESLIGQHRADPQARRQRAIYLRAYSSDRIARIAREAEALRASVRWLAEHEHRLRRWRRLRRTRSVEGYDATIGGLLAGWLDERFAGRAAGSAGDCSLYLAWTAAVREDYENYFYPAREITVPDFEGAVALIGYLAAAAVQAHGATARANARAILRRMAARYPDLEPLIAAPEVESP